VPGVFVFGVVNHVVEVPREVVSVFGGEDSHEDVVDVVVVDDELDLSAGTKHG
jgi:hypothetical protein